MNSKESFGSFFEVSEYPSEEYRNLSNTLPLDEDKNCYRYLNQSDKDGLISDSNDPHWLDEKYS